MGGRAGRCRVHVVTVAALTVAALICVAALIILHLQSARLAALISVLDERHRSQLDDVLQRVQAPDLAAQAHATNQVRHVEVVDEERVADDVWLASEDSLIEMDEDLALAGGG